MFIQTVGEVSQHRADEQAEDRGPTVTLDPPQKPKPNEVFPISETDDGKTRLSIDEIFELLSNARRRYILYDLWNNDGRVRLGDTAEQIAAWENETSVAEISAAERKSVYTALQQFHLQKMDEAGVVDFQERDGVIELGPAAADVKRCLEELWQTPEETEQLDTTTGALVLASVATLAIGLVAVQPVSPLTWGSIVVATAFLIGAGYRTLPGAW